MNQLRFWKSWPQHYKLSYGIMLGLFFIGIIVYFTAYYTGFDAVARWQTLSYLESVPVTGQSFFVGLYNFTVDGDNLLIREYFRGSPLIVNLSHSYIFLGVIVFAYALILSALSALNRFWFIVSMAGVVGVLVSFRFDQLLIFGNVDNTFLIISIILLLIPAYIFHAIKTDVSFLLKFITFLLLLTILGLIIFFFSNVQYPFLYLANYGIGAPVILGVFVIFITAHEIIYLFLYLITGSAGESKKTFLHFSILSLLYLANVLLVYFRNENILEFDFLYIDPFWLAVISLVLGIWGFRRRALQSDTSVSFYPDGAFMYIALALVFFSVTAYIFITGNDPLAEAYEDVIVFTHIGVGFLFFFYIITNFFALLMRNYKVYKVAYQPTGMPFFTARFAGFVAALALFFLSHMAALNKAMAGYYNSLGDIKLYENKLETAEQYYLYGTHFSSRNHRSNYALAFLADWKNEYSNKLEYYKVAAGKNPTQYTYVNLSNAYYESGLLFDAMFSLRAGLKLFPESAAIKNNLGRLFEQANVLDSALIYYDAATEDLKIRNAAYTNILALISGKNIPLDADSMVNNYSSIEYLPLKVNTLAVLNKAGKELSAPLNERQMPEDTLLNSHTAAYLYNHQFNHLNSDISDARRILVYAYNPSNYMFSEPLQKLSSLIYYQKGQFYEAFNVMEQVKSTYSDRELRYVNILGKWYMHQQVPQLAVDQYENAELKGSLNLNYAIALSEANKENHARRIWQNISDTLSNSKISAGQPLLTLKMSFEDALKAEDEVKYQFVRFRNKDYSSQKLLELAQLIQHDDYKSLAVSFLAGLDLAGRDRQLLERYYDVLVKTAPPSVRGQKERQWTLFNLLAALERMEELRQQFHPQHVPWDKQIDARLVMAVLAEDAADHAEAKAQFLFIIQNTPFHQFALMKAVAYLREHGDEEMLVYDGLLKASQWNPYSAVIQREYVMEALNTGLEEYAEEGLIRLRKLISDEEYRQFVSKYRKRLEEIHAQREGW